MYHPPFVFTDEEFFSALAQGKTVYEMARMFGVNRSCIYKRIRKHHIKLPLEKEPLFNEHIFDSIDTEEKAYWLGFLYADGSVTVNGKRYVLELALKANDVEHLWKFNDFLGFNRNLKKVKISEVSCNGKICRRCRISAFSKHLCLRLCELGCVPKKSLILQFPDINIFSKFEFVYDFMRGYIDGDGSICVPNAKTGSIYLSLLGTKEFISDMTKVLVSPDESFHVYHCKQHAGNTFSIYWKTTESRRICDLIYGKSTISLDRKYEKYQFAVTCSNISDYNRAKTVKAETR